MKRDLLVLVPYPEKDLAQLQAAAGDLRVVTLPETAPEAQLRQALELAFDGIECHYPRHDRKTTWLLRTLCREKKLYETCGSDDHGGFSGADVGSLKITALPAGW